MIRVSVVGGSGFTGGELIRLLAYHPEVELVQVTSERLAGMPVSTAHPNLRHMSLSFTSAEQLAPVDCLFLCLPHGQHIARYTEFQGIAPKTIDLSADFRLNTPEAYDQWMNIDHPLGHELQNWVYGIPELNREALKLSPHATGAGCNATAVVLGLWPLAQAGVIGDLPVITEVKVGSSEAGAESQASSHHPIRSGCVRSFQPTGHRHTAEIEMILRPYGVTRVDLSATAIDMVRGILATSHVYLNQTLDWRDLMGIYRDCYQQEPFIRLIANRSASSGSSA